MSGESVSLALYNYLTTDAAAADIRAMVQGGADNVFMSGDLTEEILMDALEARREEGDLTKVLAVAIQEGPEVPLSVELSGHRGSQTLVIRVYDRNRGYWNLRTAVQALRKEVRNLNLMLTEGCGTAVEGTPAWTGRTGHRWDRVYQTDYEAVTFVVRVRYSEDWN